MDRVAAKRVGFAVFGAIAAGCTLIAIACQADHVSVVGLLGAGLTNWIVPGVVAGSIGLFIWLATGVGLADRRQGERSESACPVCGKPILDDWRLCPDCGTLVEQGPKAAEQRNTPC